MTTCSICTVNDADFHKRVVNPPDMKVGEDHFCTFCAIVTGFISYADAKLLGRKDRVAAQRKNIIDKAGDAMQKAIDDERYEEAAKMRDLVGMVNEADKKQKEEDAHVVTSADRS